MLGKQHLSFQDTKIFNSMKHQEYKKLLAKNSEKSYELV